jgi:competence protein ComEC
VEVLRDRVSKVLAGRGDGGQLLRALAVGDRSGLTPGQRGAFNRLGVGHLLAVSGLHLALVAGFVFWMVRWVLVRMTRISERGDVRAAALVVAVLAAAFYAALTGWGVPVRRALVFVVVGVLSLVLGRRRSAPHLLSAASILILCSDPGVLFEMGAQLSFAASAALLVSASVDAPLAGGGLLRTLWRRVATGVRTTASAVAVTSPLVAWHGGGVGVAALLANVVAVPWVGFGLLPAALVSAGCAASGGGAADLLGDPRFEFGRPGLDWTCSVILDLGIWLARVTLLGVDRAAALAPDLRVGAAPVCWVLLLAMLLGALALRSRSVGGRLLLAWCVVLCLRLGPVSSVGPPPPRIVALDVGLGDAVLVQGESGALLVDGGGAWSRGGDAGRTAVLPALRALGVRRLDLIIATHADLDHRGGLTSVVEGVEVGELWLPPRGLVDPAFRSLIAAAHRRGSRAVERSADDPSARFGDLVVEPLWPPPHWRPPSRNDGSLVVRVAVGGGRVLLAGDLGERAERSLVDSGAELAAQVLKVGHHGSRGSASAGFLSAVGAELAIVSAPCGSTRHLPAFETLARIRGAGSALAWTGRDGALFISMGEPMFAWGWGRSRRDCGPWGDVR